jgi:hypothetical protein
LNQIGVISKYWNEAKDLFGSMINTGILDDIPFIFNGLKDIWDAITNITDGGEVRTVKQKQYEQLLHQENTKILEQTTKEQLNSLAESTIFNKLFTFYNENFENMNFERPGEVAKNLKIQAKKLFENFKNNIKLSSNKEENSRYMSMVDIDLNNIVDTIINSEDEQVQKILKGNNLKTLIASETFKELQKYYDRPDRNEAFAGDIQQKLKKINSQEFRDSVLKKEKEISNIQSNPYKDIIPVQDSIKAIKNLEKLNVLSLDSSFDFIYNRYIKLTTSVLSLISNRTKLKNYVQPIDKQADIFKNMYVDPYIPHKNGGIIAKEPTKVLIAEAGSPELIVPINDEGITFLNESIGNILNKELYKENEPDSQVSEKDTIIKRIKHFKAKPDQKLYDMRNISHGVVGVSR